MGYVVITGCSGIRSVVAHLTTNLRVGGLGEESRQLSVIIG